MISQPSVSDKRTTVLILAVLILIVLVLIGLVSTGPVWADAVDAEASTSGALHERLSVFEPYLGTWELDATWASGAKVWSKAVYEPAVGGQFVEVKTWVSDDGGPVYLRYLSFLGIGPEGEVLAQNFNHDGTSKAVDYEMPEPGVLVTRWQMGGASIRERYAPTGADTARWQVWMRPSSSEDEGAWQKIMDGTWRRSESAQESSSVEENKKMSGEPKHARPIDHGQFVAAGADIRRIEFEKEIEAPVASVFAAFSDAAAFKKAYGPEDEALEAHIDLAIGGRYEWLFDGQIGSNGCQVLSYLPNRMITFTWNAPPVQAESREKRTWVVVEFEGRDGTTSVRLTHLGFGEGPGWDETEEYFKKAWDFVLSTLKKNLES